MAGLNMTDAKLPKSPKPPVPDKRALRLRAVDADDVAVISAFLQDALIDLGDMAFIEGERRFAVVVTRFRWEDTPKKGDPKQPAERVLCGLSFEGVVRVQTRGIDARAEPRRIFELLAVQAEPEGVRLVLAGGAEVRLEMAEISIHLKDLGEPWPVFARPSHPDGD